MKKLLWFLLDGCWHEWTEYGKGNLLFKSQVVGEYFVQKCKKCGKMNSGRWHI